MKYLKVTLYFIIHLQDVIYWKTQVMRKN